ncbi:cupin domain-containing protein [Hyphomonas johnsonii]|uniref:Cupin domain-containing protein n=1 Tax=Hyphomonas johnsonii MHS-2 TaxID=1280950 RepID=A0A059FS14_9PROT|nr:cupin domain-containing protein [Hyphomonas johnsonii]KCZ93449.1 cupin domain-containing protein [Hyphomonas johnsonii MHS-2]
MTAHIQSKLFMTSPRHEAEELGGGIYRTLLGHDDRILMAKVWFDGGAVGDVHKHHHSQVSYVLSGKFEVEVDGRKQVLDVGGCFFVPSMALHGSVCLEPGVLLDVFSPAREDFLGGEAVSS